MLYYRNGKPTEKDLARAERIKTYISEMNSKFKAFMTDHGYTVKHEGFGLKATNSNTSATFSISYYKYAQWYMQENDVGSDVLVKIPYSNYILYVGQFKLDEDNLQPNLDTLDRLFADKDFLQLLDFKISPIYKDL